MAIDGPKKGQPGRTVQAPQADTKSPSKAAQKSTNSDSLKLPAHVGLFSAMRDSRNAPPPKVAQLKHKLGQDDFPSDELQGLSPHLFAEHLMLILANRRASKSRKVVMEEVAKMLEARAAKQNKQAFQ